jgi:hypothetical protein
MDCLHRKSYDRSSQTKYLLMLIRRQNRIGRSRANVALDYDRIGHDGASIQGSKPPRNALGTAFRRTLSGM